MKPGDRSSKIAILGGGNIGQAIARGLIDAAGYAPRNLYITRRHLAALAEFEKLGCQISSDNLEAVASCKTVVVAVQPGQLIGLLEEIKLAVSARRHFIISTVTGVSLAQISTHLGAGVKIVRAMPNTAVAIGESMTCLAGNGVNEKALKQASQLFGRLGKVLQITEEQMTPATALCACGIAFFLRAVRAASQGGIQIGFAAEEALVLAAQTARGAASLLQAENGLQTHPEAEIDKVTTPRGCTIAGLNRMEHEGFSSAMIRGLVTATEIASSLFTTNADDD